MGKEDVGSPGTGLGLGLGNGDVANNNEDLFQIVSDGIQAWHDKQSEPEKLDPDIDQDWQPSSDELKQMDEEGKMPAPESYPNNNDAPPLPDKVQDDSDSSGGGSEDGHEADDRSDSGGDDRGGGDRDDGG